MLKSRERNAEYLNYSVQNELVTTSVGEEQWNLLEQDARKYLFNVSQSLDKAFMYSSFPPGYTQKGWTRGAEANFLARFMEWTANGVDPRRHWGLFSLTIPDKTGYQCSIFFSSTQRKGQKYATVVGPENAGYLAETERRLFKNIVSVFLRRAKVAEERKQEKAHSLEQGFPGRGMHVGVTLCYAPPILQLLARLEEVVELCHSQLLSASRSECRLVADIADIRCQLESPGNPIVIEGIVQTVGLSTTEQEDVHEFFTRLTSQLYDEFDKTHRTGFIDIIGIQTVSKEQEGQVTNPIYSGLMTSINLTIPDRECTIDELITNYFGESTLLIEPQLLCLHLIRQKVVVIEEEQDVIRETGIKYKIQKIMTRVAYSRSICLPSSTTNYTLVETIHHEGCSVESGHYFALLYDDAGDILIDGGKVTPVSEHGPNLERRIASSQVSMAIYQTNLHMRGWFARKSSCVTATRSHVPVPVYPFASSGVWSSPPLSLCIPQHTRTLEPVSPPRPLLSRRFGFCPMNNLPMQRFATPAIAVSPERHRFMSNEERMCIAHLTGGGASPCSVASQVQRHRATVCRFLNGERGSSLSLPRYSMLQDPKLQGLVLNESLSIESKRLSCVRLAELIARKHGIHMSKETVRQLRRIVGMRFLRPIPTCPLTQSHKDKRVVFATDWLENRINLLRRTPIIFTDESKICLAEGNSRLWRIPGQCLEGEYVSIAQHPVQVMVWGAVGVGYKSKLFRFKETCNKETYMQMLDGQGIFEELDNQFGRGQYVFQQDNAPPHVARDTIAWIQARAHMINDWPARSPDLNPIEVMWALLKPKIDVSKIKTADELFKRTEEAWINIDQEIVDNVCSSFEARLRVVLHLRGNTLNGHWRLVHKVHIVLKESKPAETEKMLADVFSRDPHENNTVQDLACSSPLLTLSAMDTQAEQCDTIAYIREIEQESDDEEAREGGSPCTEEDGESSEGALCCGIDGEEPPWLHDNHEEWNEDAGAQRSEHDEDEGEPECLHEMCSGTVVEDTATAGPNSDRPSLRPSTRLDSIMEMMKAAVARFKFVFGSEDP